MSSAGGAGNSPEFLTKHESGHAVGFLALGWELNHAMITWARPGDLHGIDPLLNVLQERRDALGHLAAAATARSFA